MDLYVAFLLVAFGLIMLAGELFFPTGGVLFLAAGVAIAAGVVMSFMYGDVPTGVLTLIGVFISMPLVTYATTTWLPKTTFGQRLVQGGTQSDETIANMPVNLELEQLRGRHGKALSDLRPAGAVEFDGKRIDVVSEAMMIQAGSWVRCIDVRAGRVVVRQVDAPDLANIDFKDLGT